MNMTDDICEWEKGPSGYVGYPAYYSKCCKTKSNGLEMQTHIIADWNYCPYCGKKIKVVTEESPGTDVTEKYFGDKEWIDVRYEVPSTNRYILMSFSNFSVPTVGRYELDENGGAFHIGDEDETCVSQELFVNAWMELPEQYKG